MLQQNSSDTFILVNIKFILIKFIPIWANVSFQNLVKIYRPDCMGRQNDILISQVQAILLNE